MPEVYGSDDYSPKEFAAREDMVGVKKAQMTMLPLAALDVLAGGSVGPDTLYFTLVASHSDLGFASKNVLRVVAFSPGLILVVVVGAELFTGNNLVVMAQGHGKITPRLALSNFGRD